MAAFTGALYFNFAWFREQLCIVICPYGRLQSALIDDNSLVIGYDTARGEPAARRARRAPALRGDCMTRVRPCLPDGIDIRQGLQMECVGCTACIDACDDVMARLGRPPGSSATTRRRALEGGKRRWLRPRLAVYGALFGAAVVRPRSDARLRAALRGQPPAPRACRTCSRGPACGISSSSTW